MGATAYKERRNSLKALITSAMSAALVLDKLFTFRGDTDESWRRAEAFIAGELASLQQAGPR